MEEKKEDVIYDLNESHASHASHAGAAGVVGPQGESENSDKSENSENPDSSDSSDKSEKSENSENPDSSDSPEECDIPDPAKTEIARMVEEMGAETLLEIIRDNRNAAIRQIISEVEASQNRHIPSGASVSGRCNSIFDLAAMA